jgi:hypothetical protein
MNPDNAVAVSVGTDGFSRTKSQIMSISYAHAPEGNLVTKTVFITGAEPAKVQEYTGITPEYYHQNAVGIARAIELLEPLESAEFFVGYTVDKFTLPWIKETDLAPLVQGKPWLDMLDVCKARASDQIATELQRSASLWELWSGFAERWTNARMPGYKFDDVCNRAEVFHVGDGMTDLEAKCPRLWALYQAVLLSV